MNDLLLASGTPDTQYVLGNSACAGNSAHKNSRQRRILGNKILDDTAEPILKAQWSGCDSEAKADIIANSTRPVFDTTIGNRQIATAVYLVAILKRTTQNKRRFHAVMRVMGGSFAGSDFQQTDIIAVFIAGKLGGFHTRINKAPFQIRYI